MFKYGGGGGGGIMVESALDFFRTHVGYIVSIELCYGILLTCC